MMVKVGKQCSLLECACPTCAKLRATPPYHKHCDCYMTKDDPPDLQVDPARYLNPPIETRILVRARYEGLFVNADISELTKESLLQWLRSRDGLNPWAENVVMILLEW